MSKDEMTRFKLFLKEKGAYGLFCGRFYENHTQGKRRPSVLVSFFQKVSVENVLFDAFFWGSATEDETDFWSDCQEEWYKNIVYEY